MRKIVIILTGALALFAGSCTKDLPVVQKSKSTDLVVPFDFKWKTSNDLTVNVSGLPLTQDFSARLTISGSDENIYYSGYNNMRQDFSVKLIVPATVGELTMKWGQRTLTSPIVNNSVDFTLIQKDDQSDLGK